MEFREFGKIPRLSRNCTVTEKIDGTNASIYIGEDGEFLVGSRTRWITPEDDNFGFARWAHDHKEDLLGLGIGHHFGEWWGAGIQRKYGLDHRRFSLFNTGKWLDVHQTIGAQAAEPTAENPAHARVPAPECCHVVPVVYQGPFTTYFVEDALRNLRVAGSAAMPGFMAPEGVVIYHEAAGRYFKKTCEHDDEPKNAHPKKDRVPQARPPKNPAVGGRRKGSDPAYAGPERRHA